MKNVIKINESQLNRIIKESISKVLNEWEYDEFEFPDRDVPDCASRATIYFNPQTLELSNEKDENAAYIEVYSTDFPDAWFYHEPDTYITPGGYESSCEECGGDYEIEGAAAPDNISDEELDEIIAKFEKLHNKEIIDALTENAEFI